MSDKAPSKYSDDIFIIDGKYLGFDTGFYEFGYAITVGEWGDFKLAVDDAIAKDKLNEQTTKTN